MIVVLLFVAFLQTTVFEITRACLFLSFKRKKINLDHEFVGSVESEDTLSLSFVVFLVQSYGAFHPRFILKFRKNLFHEEKMRLLVVVKVCQKLKFRANVSFVLESVV